MSVQIVCRLDELPSGTVRRFDFGRRRIAIVRIGDDVYGIGDTCSHADFSLSEGDVLCETKELECRKHGSAFSLETGEAMTLPATQPVPVYAVSVVDGQIVVDITESTPA